MNKLTKRAKESLILKKLKWEQKLWKQGIEFIAGIDEAGRGPLAGPVVAAAVIFPKTIKAFDVNDSKKLTAIQRKKLYDIILSEAIAVGTGICDEKVIDKINILQATFKAMKKGLASLSVSPSHVFVDGSEIPGLKIPQTAIVKGDEKCFSIAAASIIAKVTRDRLMIEYEKKFPGYYFSKHKGYPTKQHVAAINELGLCPIHRKSFKVNSTILEDKKKKSSQSRRDAK